MAKISPFQALRPAAELAPKVASKPYDVLNSKEAKVESQGNSFSFLHITKSEIDLPENTDIHSQVVYDTARQNLDAFVQRNILFRESKPCYYIYELVMDGRSQTGLVCVSSVDDYESNIIKKHEFTRPEKEQDRINHIKTTGAQTGNVFLAYRQVSEIDTLIEHWKAGRTPIYNFKADDNIQHAIWVVNDTATIAQITDLFASSVPHTYIADGHHRAASAAQVRKHLGAAAKEGANFFLTTLFPSSQLYIMDYNRVAKDLNGHSKEDFLRKVEEKFTIEPAGNKAVKPGQLHQFGMFLDGEWYRLTAKPGIIKTDPIGVLDVTILQDNVLAEILNIQDPRTDTRIDFVGGIRGLAELEKRVKQGDGAVAFSLFPVSIDQLFDIADSGNVMPPKSTWFEPKLRDGLLTHLIG
ncbi:DUF1015 domain-containing protein [Segetibacter sp. 3557_3]|uniref:DUF1015 domain-containing protein n=1 Tax=Segetibacter sp. 3557_3 TaxID=2547429 RepID=UPI0010585B78|nr:DUF1015 family protein [Segetibacter sp. 3557_3]TDH26188.1 DUF1015 domain-containing protein [Segetibacter sp. 3557_3]